MTSLWRYACWEGLYLDISHGMLGNRLSVERQSVRAIALLLILGHSPINDTVNTVSLVINFTKELDTEINVSLDYESE